MCSVSKKCRQGHCYAGFFGYRVWDHLLAIPSKSAERHQLATYLLSWSDEVHKKKRRKHHGDAGQQTERARAQVQQLRECQGRLSAYLTYWTPFCLIWKGKNVLKTRRFRVGERSRFVYDGFEAIETFVGGELSPVARLSNEGGVVVGKEGD